MKKILAIGLTALVVLSSCTDKKKLEEAQSQTEATRAELVAAVNDRDQLLELVNAISSDMEQIKSLENILTVSGGSETPGQRGRIKADISAIQKTLQERRERLAELEKKLNDSSVANAGLKKTIASLRSQIDSQAAEITTLRASLESATGRIGELDAAVDSLHAQVSNVTAERDSTQVRNEDLTNELNQCFYAIGTKSELKENKIIETGFLRKTKLMKGDFDRAFFTTADKRTLTTIPLNSNKAKVLTNQPAGSYVISDNAGSKVLRITNPAAFWSLSNYLVIQID